MRFFSIALATVFVFGVALECQAQKPNRDKKQGQQARQRNRQQGNDQADRIAKLIQRFDKNGDSKLGPRELGALLQELRERRRDGDQNQGQGRRGNRRQGAGQGRPGKNKDGNMNRQGNRQKGQGKQGGRKGGKGKPDDGN